jgi:hypothetical protein
MRRFDNTQSLTVNKLIPNFIGYTLFQSSWSLFGGLGPHASRSLGWLRWYNDSVEGGLSPLNIEPGVERAFFMNYSRVRSSSSKGGRCTKWTTLKFAVTIFYKFIVVFAVNTSCIPQEYSNTEDADKSSHTAFFCLPFSMTRPLGLS